MEMYEKAMVNFENQRFKINLDNKVKSLKFKSK